MPGDKNSMEKFEKTTEKEESPLARFQILIEREKELMKELFRLQKVMGGAEGYLKASPEEREKIKKLSELLKDNNEALDSIMARIEEEGGEKELAV